MGNGSFGRNKPTTNLIQAQAVTANVYEKKEIRNGFIRIFPGVRCGDKNYTSPVLAIHTWSKDTSYVKTHAATLGTTNQSGGFFGPDRSNSVMTNVNQKAEEKLGLDENVQIVPLEDVLAVHVETVVKKATAQQTQRRLKTPPPEDHSCVETTKKWCMANVCCCCCTATVAPAQIVETKREEQSANRVILFMLDYFKHSNVHTPSTVKVLATEKQHEHFKKKLDEEKIKFYYLHNADVNQDNFVNEMKEAEKLARIIIQIKGMSPNYPDPAQLQEIIKQQEAGFFGFASNEEMADRKSVV